MAFTGEMPMDIVEELSRGISAWIAVAPNRNRGLLQKRTGVCEATLRRIHYREQKGVSLEIVLELAHVLYDTEDAIAFIKRHFPVAGRWQERYFSKRDDVVTLGEYLRNPTYYKIFLLCDTKTGATIEEIKEELGAEGVRDLSKLVEIGLISYSNGYHKFASEGLTLVASHSVHCEMLQHMIRFYNPENANKKSLCAEFVYSQGFNREAIEFLAPKIWELEETIKATIENPDYRGDIPWFIGLVQNVLRGDSL
jgi:hypothetical protein